MWILAGVLGVFAIDDDGNVIDKELYGVPPQKDLAIKAINQLESGELPDEFKILLERLKPNTVKTDSETIAILVRKHLPGIKVELIEEGEELLKAREAVHTAILEAMGDYRSYIEFANEVLVTITKDKLRAVGEEPDKMIIQAITLIERLTESINAFMAHLREWYGIIFPELGKIIDDHKTFATLVYELGKPENFTKENLEKVLKNEKLINKVLEALDRSVIVKITNEDEKQLKDIAKLILDMFSLRDQLQKYLTELMEDTAPNITALVGPTIGAKLIRKAGGLRQLALKPASTIQVLGAEKALFRALRGKGTPPKHGIIFTHPLIFKAPWWQRGKIARALATKLAIAARVDYFSKEYIGDELKNELMMRVKEIKKKYPKPPPEKIKKKKKGKKPKERRRKKRR